MSEPVRLGLAMGVPTLAVLIGILINNSRVTDLRTHFDSRLSDTKDTLRAELLRVEGVLDARLTVIERELKLR